MKIRDVQMGMHILWRDSMDHLHFGLVTSHYDLETGRSGVVDVDSGNFCTPLGTLECIPLVNLSSLVDQTRQSYADAMQHALSNLLSSR